MTEFKIGDQIECVLDYDRNGGVTVGFKTTVTEADGHHLYFLDADGDGRMAAHEHFKRVGPAAIDFDAIQPGDEITVRVRVTGCVDFQGDLRVRGLSNDGGSWIGAKHIVEHHPGPTLTKGDTVTYDGEQGTIEAISKGEACLLTASGLVVASLAGLERVQ